MDNYLRNVKKKFLGPLGEARGQKYYYHLRKEPSPRHPPLARIFAAFERI